MANVLVTIAAVTDDVVPAPIDGVDVFIYDEFDAFVAQGVTGDPTPGSGEYETLLPGDGPGIDYTLRFFKAGTSFPASLPISVTDPPAPDNDFSVTGHEGQVGQLVQVVVKDDALTPAPVESVRVRLFDSLDAFLAEFFTDSSGIIDAVIEGDPDPGRTYIIRLFKDQWTFPGGATQLIAVQDPLVPPDTNIFDVTAHLAVPEESADPDLCRITGYVTDASLRALKDITLRILPREVYPSAVVAGFPFPSVPTPVRDKLLVSGIVTKSDKNGKMDFLLPRESIFDIHIYGLETPGVQIIEQVWVPDAAAMTLRNLLFPYVASVVFAEDPIAVLESEAVEVAVTVTGSNGQDIVAKSALLALLDFTSEDEAVATVEVDDGLIRVTGVGAGSTTITVTRKEGTTPTQRPAIVALLVTAPVVSVT
jgi:hypothetical protein